MIKIWSRKKSCWHRNFREHPGFHSINKAMGKPEPKLEENEK